MLKIEKSEAPSQWTCEGTVLQNPKIGRIQLVDVCDETGKFLYQQPIWSEVRGEVDIVVNKEGSIAFVLQERHVVIDPKYYTSHWQVAPDPLDFKEAIGVRQLELPRGISKNVLREAEEETGYRVGPVEWQTNINANTALFATSPFLFVARAMETAADVPVDPNERIKQVVWMPAEATRDLETLCAFTLAGLQLFRGWALKSPDAFWQKIGQRM